MSKPSKKKFEKQKKREEAGKKKVLALRLKRRAEAKEEKRLWRLERASEPKLRPFVKSEFLPLEPEATEAKNQPSLNVRQKRTPEEIAAQIQKNFEVLRALEDDYEKQMAEREGLNEALEAEGYTTLKEKMEYLKKKAEAEAQEAYEKRIKDSIKK